MLRGKVGKHKIEMKSLPQAHEGEVEISINGRIEKVRFKRDPSGIWIQYSNMLRGYDWQICESETEGLPTFDLRQRYGNEYFENIRFSKEGEETLSSSSLEKTKTTKIKSQMPGKILKISVTLGQKVALGQTLLFMEAMKMENEIKSPSEGVVTKIAIEQGQNIETGTLLVVIESA